MSNHQKTQSEDFYWDKGLMVMTETFHLKRGYCCGNKCKHCPYNHQKVTPLPPSVVKKKTSY